MIRLIGRMPLASAANMAPLLGMGESQLRTLLRRLGRAGWVASMNVGMTEPAQLRWFATSEAARAVYADEQVPWTATARGVRTCLRRLPALEMLYRFAPGLRRAGWLFAEPALEGSRRSGAEAGTAMTGLRLLRNGGWFHAVAAYGDLYWATFTFVGPHATERSLRRKRAHRFWGLDTFSSEHDMYERAAGRVFYVDPVYEATPSAQVILAADGWAAHLAEAEFAGSTRPLICTPEGRWNDPVELQPSRDSVADPIGSPSIGRAEQMARWRRQNRDVLTICDPVAHALFVAVAQFPALRRAELRALVGASRNAVDEALDRFVETDLIDLFDGHCYLTERGMRRAANLSRLLASALIRRHGAYLNPAFRLRRAATLM